MCTFRVAHRPIVVYNDRAMEQAIPLSEALFYGVVLGASCFVAGVIVSASFLLRAVRK